MLRQQLLGGIEHEPASALPATRPARSGVGSRGIRLLLVGHGITLWPPTSANVTKRPHHCSSTPSHSTPRSRRWTKAASPRQPAETRSEEHTSELQSLMRNSYSV